MEERLVFNKEQHQIYELEKYGFKRVEFRKCFSDFVRSYQLSVDTMCMDIVASNSTIIVHDKDSIDYEGNIQLIIEDKTIPMFGSSLAGVDNKILCVLFDLIKDGLVIKDKKDE